MQVFKFNIGGRTVERAVADAIGQGISQSIGTRRDSDSDMPQQLKQLVAQLDDTNRDQAHNLARLKSRKVKED